jgi:hypothetical protein
MPLLAVALELRSQVSGFDYEPLFRELDRLAALPVQRSLYLLEVKKTARELVLELSQFVAENDSLISFETYGKIWCNNPVRGAERWLTVSPPLLAPGQP